MHRFLAGVAVCVAVAMGTTGCSLVAEIGTNKPYSRSGVGINIEDVGPLELRNVLIVANEDGSKGNLIAAIINNTDDNHVLHVRVGEGSSAELNIPVPAETTVSFGHQGNLEDPPLIEGLGALPGSTVQLHFQAGDAEGTIQHILVLNGCLPFLEGLEPDGRRTPGECPRMDSVDP